MKRDPSTFQKRKFKKTRKVTTVTETIPDEEKTTAAAAVVVVEESSKQKRPKLGEILPGLVVGINAVSRAAEAGSLAIIIFARDSSPPILIAHLPVVARVKDIPILSLACSSAELGEAVGVRNALTIGIQTAHRERYSALFRELSPFSRVPRVPWMDALPGRFMWCQARSRATTSSSISSSIDNINIIRS